MDPDDPELTFRQYYLAKSVSEPACLPRLECVPLTLVLVCFQQNWNGYTDKTMDDVKAAMLDGHGILPNTSLPDILQQKIRAGYAAGVTWMDQQAGRVLDTLESVAYQIDGRTICAFGEACAWPVESMIDRFRDELLADTVEDNPSVARNAEQEAQRRYLQDTIAKAGKS